MFDFNKKSLKKSNILVRRISADRLTPIKILSQMKVVALLESAYIKTGKSRYSIMVLKNAFTIYKKGNQYFLKDYNNKEYLIKQIKKMVFYLY